MHRRCLAWLGATRRGGFTTAAAWFGRSAVVPPPATISHRTTPSPTPKPTPAHPALRTLAVFRTPCPCGALGNFAEMNEKAAAGPSKGRRGRSASRDKMAAMGGGGGGMAGMEQLAQMMGGAGGGAGMEQLMQMMGGGDMNEMMTKLMGSMGDMDMGQIMSQGIEMWEQAIDSPEMEAMFNDPNQLRETMEPFIEMFGGECGVWSVECGVLAPTAPPSLRHAMPVPCRCRADHAVAVANTTLDCLATSRALA